MHICIETTQGISLYSYLLPKLAKILFFFLSYMFFNSKKLENKRVKQVLPGAGGNGTGKGCPNTYMYIHVSKCKNDKIKLKKEML
jgi:hypothetical protein